MTRSQAREQQEPQAGLTHETILQIAGDISDAKVAAVEATGATPEELEEAALWAMGEDDVMGKLRLPLSGRVAELYEILTADEDYGNERD
jgi:hypothetical protein